MFCFSWLCNVFKQKHLMVDWVRGWMTLFVWNSAEAECTVLLPFRVTDMERAKKDSETLCAVFGWLGLRSEVLLPSLLLLHCILHAVAGWSFPKSHITHYETGVVSSFHLKWGKSQSEDPRMDLIQPL